jgi:hypothetical protein
MLAAIDLLHFHDSSLKLENYSLAKRWQTSADRAAGPAAISTALITCAETHEVKTHVAHVSFSSTPKIPVTLISYKCLRFHSVSLL